MNFLSLLGVEFQKIKRSKILFVLLAATVILWMPSVLNAHLNFEMQAEGISPEHNFFIQGFMGMAWFILVRFRHKVVPGDTLIFHVSFMTDLRRGCAVMKGYAFVGEKIVTECEFMAQIVKNK